MERVLTSEGGARDEDKLIRQEPEGQEAFMWRSIGLHLRLSGDPDWAIFAAKEACFLRGVRLGLDGLMPRTPAVYQRKVKWRTYDEVWDGESISKSYYESVTDNLEAVEGMVREDVSLGRRRLEAECAARAEYGQHLVMAAIGALEKGG
eukprot:7896129-Karenia_brevis.AAC.1